MVLAGDADARPAGRPSTAAHLGRPHRAGGRAGRPASRSPTDDGLAGRCGSTPPAPPACPRPRCTGTPTSGTSARPTAPQVLGITPDDATFSVAKLFFAYGIGNSVFFPFSVGATHRPRAAPAHARRRTRAAASRTGPRCSSRCRRSTPRCSPATCRTTRSRRCGCARRPASRCRRRCSSGSPTGSASTILDGIGSTEALHIFLSNRPGDIRPGTTGHAGARATTSRSATPPGAGRRDGRAGRAARARRVDRARLLAPHRRLRQVFQGEWLVTGDTYVRDDDGYYTCLGRNSDMLKAGGIWVSPAEVESRLLEHPAVREAAVVGVPDERRPRQAGRRRRGRPTGVDRGRAGRLVPRGARALQGAPAGGVRRGPARRPRPASCSASRCATSSADDPRRRARRRPEPTRHRRSPHDAPSRSTC